MRTLSGILLFFVSSITVSAQDTTRTFFLKTNFADFYSGTITTGQPGLTFDEMKQAVPDAQMIRKDFTGYHLDQRSLYGFGSFNVNEAMGLRVGFIPYSKRTKSYSKHAEIYAGIYYSANYEGEHILTLKTTHRFDTLQSSNNVTYYLDSIQHFRYDFTYYMQTVSIDFCQVFHTNDERIFSAWIGYGFTAGMNVGSYYTGSYTHHSSTGFTSTAADSITYQTDFKYDDSTETRRISSAYNLRFYVPVGMQFRFSKKPKFASHFAFFMDVRFGVDMQKIPNLSTISRTFVSPTAGFRYYIRKIPPPQRTSDSW